MTAPRVSVVIPCRNEAQRIAGVLEALRAQDFRNFELIVVDGQSEDGTVDIVRGFAAAHPTLKVKLLDNPARSIPAALNLGIEAAAGEIIARFDAHALPEPDYVQRCVTVLEDTRAAIVGGGWEIRPGGSGLIAQAIAAAVSTPLGAGDARYRLGGPAADVDTVPFGCFRRTLWLQLGGYDPELLANEDYEFAWRARRAGGRVRFDPSIRSRYFARGTYADLVSQYWRYGWWKARMLARHPDSLRWRQLAPGFWGIGGPALIFLGWAAAWWRPMGLAAWAAYILLLTLGALRQAGARARFALALIWAYTCIHFAWGWGLCAGLTCGARQQPE